MYRKQLKNLRNLIKIMIVSTFVFLVFIIIFFYASPIPKIPRVILMCCASLPFFMVGIFTILFRLHIKIFKKYVVSLFTNVESNFEEQINELLSIFTPQKLRSLLALVIGDNLLKSHHELNIFIELYKRTLEFSGLESEVIESDLTFMENGPIKRTRARITKISGSKT